MDKQYYETTVIVNGALEEDQVKQVVDRISDFITRNGGEIGNVDHWGRRRLAFPINKKNNGYYVQFNINAPGDMVAQMERFFSIEEQVIRSLTLQMSDKDVKRREEAKERLAAIEAAESAAVAGEEGQKGDDDRRRGGDR